MGTLSDDLLNLVESAREFQRVLQRLSAGDRCIAGGLWGSGCALITAALARHAPTTTLLVTPTLEAAESAHGDLATWLPQQAALFPGWEILPTESRLSDEISTVRLEMLQRLLDALSDRADLPAILVAPIQALLQAVPSPETLQERRLVLRTGQAAALHEIARWLVSEGFERVPMAETPGQFAIRGGILDIYPLTGNHPVRIEFFGEQVESMREFDAATQRSVRSVDSCCVLSASASTLVQSARSASAATLLRYLPQNFWLILREPLEIQERAEQMLQTADEPARYFTTGELLSQSQGRPLLEVTALPPPAGPHSVDFNWQSTQRVSGNVATLAGELLELARECDRIVVFCNNPGEQERLRQLLSGTPAAAGGALEYRLGRVSEGFRIPALRLAILTHHEMFQRYGRRRVASPRRRGAPIESFAELEKGDYVVHIAHGIARYLGTEMLQREGGTEEFLVLQFAEGAKLYVPATRIPLVQKYIGSRGSHPPLSKLGGTAWHKRKERVKEALRDLAFEMLQTQALRNKLPGTAFPEDDHWQREFEAAFLYEETDDQLVVNEEVKRDLQSTRPMDRLMCGDVGYGKTELAMRAAFKVVMFGKQVAVLVPTTILAEQHYRTFSERMADYPVRIEVLSRFKTQREQREILEATRTGHVDILIGTHRLFGADVQFHDLGLLVIDEEQRFGVRHKEQLKRLRALVDILTMTATPIPRTLHMALVGIKDISALNTPPPDRLAIHTEVCRWDDSLIRQAILREMNRSGQVYFVHNRVYDIEEVAARLREIVPEARLIIAHGQMPEHHLDANMKAFIEGRYDVLLSTTIIESGLDIPNVNTLFVNRADDFGLADLHQLRGRVGRYKHRAYAYFLIPRDRPISPKAYRRLKAIEEFHELGSGFKIALRDLEIRGAGNILGVEQHGHIAAVGYDLYCKLLNACIRELRGEEVRPEPEITIDFGLDAYLPAAYIPDELQRMEIYRKIARASVLAEIEGIYEELKDRFGEPPQCALDLLARETLRIFAVPLGITYLGLRRAHVLAKFTDPARIHKTFAALRGKVRIVDNETMHILLPAGFESPQQVTSYVMGLLQHRPGVGLPAALSSE